MQFERAADGTMTPLPKPSVDTGMGLERMAAVMQGVHSNYDIDLFRNLIAAAAEATHAEGPRRARRLRVIADHIRACSFLIVDGVIPGQRRPRLRAAPHHPPRDPPRLPARPAPSRSSTRSCRRSSPRWARPTRSSPKGADHVVRVLQAGRGALRRDARERHGAARGRDREAQGQDDRRRDGLQAVRHLGFPVDLTADIARERGLAIDQAGFEQAMEAQRERARAASKFGVDLRGPDTLDAESKFTRLRAPAATRARSSRS